MTREELKQPSVGETPRKSPLRRWALVLGSVVLGAAILGGVIFFVVLRMTAEPEQVVRDFLAQAAAGDYAAAHAHFSEPLKQVQSLEPFSAAVQANSMFFQATDLSFNQRSIDQAGAELAGTVTLESGTVVPANFSLVREGESWKLIKYHIGS
ncbi:MAG: hypothetical protein WDZ66_11615 [Steroidobacteraceae bacterium]